jgi:hypothetical protein
VRGCGMNCMAKDTHCGELLCLARIIRVPWMSRRALFDTVVKSGTTLSTRMAFSFSKRDLFYRLLSQVPFWVYEWLLASPKGFYMFVKSGTILSKRMTVSFYKRVRFYTVKLCTISSKRMALSFSNSVLYVCSVRYHFE